MDGVRIDFVRGETRRYRSVLHRPDGVDVAFEGGSYNAVGGPAREVPHDIAHLVVEDELDLRLGVWGVLVAGGLFGHAKVVAGRQAPHAARRGREVIAAAGDRLMQAEILTRAVCDLAVAGADTDVPAVRRAAGERWWSETVTAEALGRACRRLRDAGAAWARLAPGESVAGAWRRPPAKP